ncbi:MAG TPA: hypothetical protein VII50_07440 [Acidothermaceae bacterium]
MNAVAIFVILTALACFLACCLALPWWPLSSLDRATVAEFAAAHNLALTPASGRYVVGYLVRNLRWRRWGGFAGLALALVLSNAMTHTATTTTSAGQDTTITSTHTSHSLSWFLLIGIGYFGGALIAEWRSGATITGPRRAASLQVRDARDYLDPTFRRTTYRALAAGALLVTAAASWPGYRQSTSLAERIALLALLLLVVVVTQVATQWVARRPQPLGDDLLTAREAVRTSCVNLLGGIGVAFAWFVLSWVASSSRAHSPGVINPVASLTTIVAFVMSVRCWFRLRRRAWTTDFRHPRVVA